MRVSTGMIFDAGVNTMNRQTASLLHLQQQVASGRRILTPSDDPVSAARALEVTQSRDIGAQFRENQDNANASLGLEEAQLTSSTDLLARVRELAVQAGNSHLSNSDRRALAFELRARFDEMLGIANATDGGGQFIFSGYKGSVKPFGGSVEEILAAAADDVDYFGDEGQRRLQVSPTRFLEVSDSGDDVFMRIRNGNGYFVTDYAKDYSTDPAGVSTNIGTAIIDGGTVSDPVKWNANAGNYTIKFSTDTSVPPVTYYDILDAGGASVIGATPTGPAMPPTPNPAPGATHALSGQRIYHSGQPIILGPITGDTATPPDLGANITITGDPFGGEAPPGKGWDAGDSFTITPSTSQSVFSTVAKLIGSLETATPGAAGGMAKLANDIGFALTNLDQATENILRVRAQIGSRMGEIDSLKNVNENLDLQYQENLSQLQDLDYAKAITDMQRKQIDLEAAQKSFMTTSKLSLFNYI